MTTPCNPPGGKVHSSCLYLNPWSSSVYLTKQTEPSQSTWIVVVGFFFPVGVPKDSRAVWEALSKPFLCPIQGKPLPGMSFKGKMSSVDPPIVLFSFHLPLPTFKGPILSLGKFLPQGKEEEALSRGTSLDLENLRSSGFGKVFWRGTDADAVSSGEKEQVPDS